MWTTIASGYESYIYTTSMHTNVSHMYMYMPLCIHVHVGILLGYVYRLKQDRYIPHCTARACSIHKVQRYYFIIKPLLKLKYENKPSNVKVHRLYVL